MTNKKIETQETVPLALETLLKFVDEMELAADKGNVHYSTKGMLKLYLYMLVKRISGFKTIAKQLRLKPQLCDSFGFKQSPHRTTLSRRFKALPEMRVSVANVFCVLIVMFVHLYPFYDLYTTRCVNHVNGSIGAV